MNAPPAHPAATRPPGRALLWRMLLVLLAMALASMGNPAMAAPADGIDIPLQLCTAAIRSADSPQAKLASLAGFDCHTKSSLLGPGSWWVRLQPPGGTLTAGMPANLSFMPGWENHATLYVRHADGSTDAMALDNRTLSRATRIGARVVVPLPGSASPADAILLRFDGAINTSGLVYCAALRDATASHRDELRETAIYCGFAGLCLALLVYNLALLMPIRQGFQLTYCLMLFSMLTYAWAHSGGWSLWLPEHDITQRYRLSYISLGLCSTLAVRFFVGFLESGVLPRWLQQLAMAQRLALLACSAAILVAGNASMPLLDRIFIWLFVALQFLAVTMTVTALWRGSRAAWIMLLTWTIPLLSCVMRLAYALHLVGYTAWTEHAPLLAMSVNALLSSLAIALRVKMLAEERDEARHEERIARRLADIDPLTGLLNRRGLLERASLERESHTLLPRRLLVIDVDHFKAINDGHGHDMGDEVLRELAQLLSRRCGRRGQVARLGGEEFAVFGPSADLPPALALSILADVRQHTFAHGLGVTVSIGMAEGMMPADPQDRSGWNSLYRRADTALYEAKASGRNRVVDAGLLEAGIRGLSDLAARPLEAVS
jgi:diguanylate cyclase (GGDEF)-like protein